MSNIKTAKIGTRYENAYYYKQKVVNWEFVAPTAYDSFIYTPTTQLAAHSTCTVSLTAFATVDVQVSRYITEESYARHSTYYRMIVTNVITGTPAVLLLSYYNTDPVYSIDTEINALVDTDTPTVYLETEMIGDNNTYAYTSIDNILFDTHCMFPTGTYTTTQVVPAEGMFCEMDTKAAVTQATATTNVVCSIIEHRDITTVPIVLEGIETAQTPQQHSSYITTAGAMLPVATFVASTAETTTTVMLAHAGYVSSVTVSHIDSTFI